MIKYISGDVTNPTLSGPTVLIHCCNNIGKFGAGVALAIARRFPSARNNYLLEHSKFPFQLGEVQFVRVEDSLYIANMIGQDGLISKNNPTPIKYDAIDECLKNVAAFCLDYKVEEVIGPKFGSGFSGGSWDKIEPLIVKNLINNGLPVTIYSL